MDINRRGVSKEVGIGRMLSLRGWPEEGLLAIGDGGNDLRMIERYKGVTVESAGEEVKNAAAAIYKDVGEMLRENM
jgi:hydroxymethylpyrimidine pyrophosphatase-like HAD family hydrolase